MGPESPGGVPAPAVLTRNGAFLFLLATTPIYIYIYGDPSTTIIASWLLRRSEISGEGGRTRRGDASSGCGESAGGGGRGVEEELGGRMIFQYHKCLHGTA